MKGFIHGAGPFDLTFYDVAWRALDRFPVNHGALELDHTLPGSGTYFFTLRDNERVVHVGKVVVL